MRSFDGRLEPFFLLKNTPFQLSFAEKTVSKRDFLSMCPTRSEKYALLWPETRLCDSLLGFQKTIWCVRTISHITVVFKVWPGRFGSPKKSFILEGSLIVIWGIFRISKMSIYQNWNVRFFERLRLLPSFNFKLLSHKLKLLK